MAMNDDMGLGFRVNWVWGCLSVPVETHGRASLLAQTWFGCDVGF
ncbi:MAG: hypothetical protein ACLFT6_01030 [Bacteroidales bacterium]